MVKSRRLPHLRRDYCRTVAVTCTCGCGRAIKGIKARANNTVAGQITEDVEVLRGALERGDVAAHTDTVIATVAQGEVILEGLITYLHGNGSSGVDKGATRAWLGAARELRGQLTADATNPWLPSDGGNDVVANTGVRSRGVITEVRRTGGNEFVARLDVAVEARDDSGEVIVLRRGASISVIQVPRVGDQVEISYHPTDRSRFVFRPVIER